jgi:hypothetical protein
MLLQQAGEQLRLQIVAADVNRNHKTEIMVNTLSGKVHWLNGRVSERGLVIAALRTAVQVRSSARNSTAACAVKTIRLLYSARLKMARCLLLRALDSILPSWQAYSAQ